MEMSKLSVPTLDVAEPGSGVVYQRGTGGFSQMLVQPDGKVLVLGSVPGGWWPAPALFRFNADGSLDTSFAANGRTPGVLHLNGELHGSTALQLDPETRDVLIVTDSQGVLGVYRVTADGEPVTGWGANGGHVVWLSGTETQFLFEPKGMVVTPEGDLLIAASQFDYVQETGHLLLKRLSPDGSVDPEFGADLDIRGTLTLFAELPAQRMLMGGIRTDGDDLVAFLAQLDAQGQLDESWGTEGVLELPVEGFVPREVQVQADGRILLAGYFTEGRDEQTGTQAYSLALMRLLPDGSLDTSFHAQGPTAGLLRQIDGTALTWTGDGSVEPDVSLSMNAAGQILWAVPQQSGLTLVRLDSSGELDEAFNPEGPTAGVQTVQWTAGPQSYYSTQALMDETGGVLFGTALSDPVAWRSSEGGVFLGRLTPDGSRDASFGLPADVISATHASDVLPSSLGARIDGYGGVDWVEFSGRLADYQIEGERGAWRVEGPDSFSVLIDGVERLRFEDAVLALDIDHFEDSGSVVFSSLGSTGFALALVRTLYGEAGVQDGVLLGRAVAYVDALGLDAVLRILDNDGTLAERFGHAMPDALLRIAYENFSGESADDDALAALADVLSYYAPREDRSLQENVAALLNSELMHRTLIEQTVGGRFTYQSHEGVIVGTQEGDVLRASAGGSRLDGTGGTDEVIFDAVRSRFSIERLEDGGLRVDGGTHGVTELIHVERLRFADGVRAFDLAPDESAGQAARLLAALAGAEALHSPLNLIGQAITLVDRLGAEGTARTVVNNGVVADLAGGDSLDALIGLLHRNLTGSAPTQAELDWTLDWAESQQMDAADLLLFAADLPQVAELIGVDELARDGLAYYPAFNLG